MEEITSLRKKLSKSKKEYTNDVLGNSVHGEWMMLFWLPVQLYYIYRFFFDRSWKTGFKKRHWFYRGFVYLMIGTGVLNILQLAFIALVYLSE